MSPSIEDLHCTDEFLNEYWIGAAVRLVKSKVFIMPLSAYAHKVLTWNISSIVRFFLRRGPKCL